MTLNFSSTKIAGSLNYLKKHHLVLALTLMTAISLLTFWFYYQNGLGLAYNDARSHLDIGRRVVEGLKPGFAQIGSVWLPLPHVLMIPTVWNDFLWHSGLSGALISMAAFIATGFIIYKFLEALGAPPLARLFGLAVFTFNLNILYLQSTAMTELLLLATMTAGAYFITRYAQNYHLNYLIAAALMIMLSTLTRYDGWFLLVVAAMVLGVINLRRRRLDRLEGSLVLFLTLGGLGTLLWFLWNLLIFGDPLYFAFGRFSAHAQQTQIESAGQLDTKGNLLLSIKVYLYALIYNSYLFPVLMGLAGFLITLTSKLKSDVKIALTTLLAPLLFNIIALYLGHSVLFLEGITGETWFNVRYGIMLAPSIAIFSGLLISRLPSIKPAIIGVFALTTLFAFINADAVTIDDARVGASQKNVTEVSSWLNRQASGQSGFILISAASHDAIIFSSGLPMKRFIHEGTGAYWQSATEEPDRWARWIIVRSNDDNDLTWSQISGTKGFNRYTKVESYPFADIYELQESYLSSLITEPIYGNRADLKKR
jgi:hypothetical protein